MAIRSFSLGPNKGLSLAQAENIPNLMVIAGPNGAGKSSLLDLIRNNRWSLQEPGTTTLYVGPHRTWRSSQINKVMAFGFSPNSYREILATDSLPTFQYVVPPGLQSVAGQVRQSSSADDVQAFVKTSLIRLRDRQQSLVTGAWSAQGQEVAKGSVPDLFEPFAELVREILPHLTWVGVDDSQPENIRVLFRATGGDGAEFDIDDLSSGEKSALALLLPFVEQRAEQLVTADVADGAVVPITMLMDEIEIHLHPTLQLQVLEYIRQLARTSVAQFIVTTHSNTILDELATGELWLLSAPAGLFGNQLQKLATSDEHLEVARSLTGSTHALTRSKPIVFVEGEVEKQGGASDVRLLRLLVPDTRTWALIARGSKRSVMDAVETMRRQSLEMPGNPVFGLVDSDRDDALVADPHVIQWPVAMIENLLLSPEAVIAGLHPFRDRIAVSSADEVASILAELSSARIDEEVELRVRSKLPVGRLEILPAQLADVRGVGASQLESWLAKVNGLDLSRLRADAESEVQSIVRDGKELDRFHGKRILRALYSRLHLSDILPVGSFTLVLADEVASTGLAAGRLKEATNQITLYFPGGLQERLQDAALPELAARCGQEYDLWRERKPKGDQRASLRAEVFAALPSLGELHRSDVAKLAAEIGTP